MVFFCFNKLKNSSKYCYSDLILLNFIFKSNFFLLPLKITF